MCGLLTRCKSIKLKAPMPTIISLSLPHGLSFFDTSPMLEGKYQPNHSAEPSLRAHGSTVDAH